MDILVIDVGGTHIKVLVSTADASRKFPSGPTMTPEQMVAGVKEATKDWKYEVISMGYPGPVLHHHPVADPANMGKGWVGFDFEKAFGLPIKIINDAAMQALGSYDGGRMLFLGFGTGLGSALIADGMLQPMELGHLPYRKGTFEDYVGIRGLLRLGKKKWRKRVADVIERMSNALEVDYVVLGGGNAELLKELPPKCRKGANANAFVGGFRLWNEVNKSSVAIPDDQAIPISGPAPGKN